MQIRFIFHDGKVFETELIRELNILAHAQILEIDIGSECGGHGICGKDRIFVQNTPQEALSSPSELEIQHLGRSLVQKDTRLACQAYPSGLHSIEVYIHDKKSYRE